MGPCPNTSPSTAAPIYVPSQTPTSKPTVNTPSYLKEDFYASLPLYAKILFTFAIVSVGFAICFFTYKKIYKPRLEPIPDISSTSSRHINKEEQAAV